MTMINKPQTRILASLKKAGKPMTKVGLAKASGVNMNWIAEYVGTPDGEDFVRRAGVLTDTKKLAPAGYVKIVVSKDEASAGERFYSITPSGVKALDKATKEKAKKVAA